MLKKLLSDSGATNNVSWKHLIKLLPHQYLLQSLENSEQYQSKQEMLHILTIAVREITHAYIRIVK